jgi:hypothetical protein
LFDLPFTGNSRFTITSARVRRVLMKIENKGREFGLRHCSHSQARLRVEPSVEELMDDPLTHALMRCDDLTPEDVWTIIREARRALAARRATQVAASHP